MSSKGQKGLQTSDDSTSSGSSLQLEEASQVHGGGDRASSSQTGPENIDTEDTVKEPSPSKSAQGPASHSAEHKPVSESHSADSQSAGDNTSGDASEMPSNLIADSNVRDNRSPTSSGPASDTDISSSVPSETRRGPITLTAHGARYNPESTYNPSSSGEIQPSTEPSTEPSTAPIADSPPSQYLVSEEYEALNDPNDIPAKCVVWILLGFVGTMLTIMVIVFAVFGFRNSNDEESSRITNETNTFSNDTAIRTESLENSTEL